MPRGRATRQSFERLEYDVSHFRQRSALSISARVESPAIALVVAVVLGNLICHVAAASHSAVSEPKTILTTATLATSEDLVWTWSRAADLHGSSFRMIDGRILIFGGVDSRFVDLYDPETDTWSTVGETAQPGSKVSVAQASTGEVLIAGGVDRELEVFDPATEEWSRIPLPHGMETDETVTEIGADRWLVTGFGETSAAILHRGDGMRRVFVPFVIRQVR